MKKAIGVLINDIHLTKDNGELVKDIFRQLIEICNEYSDSKSKLGEKCPILCGGDVFTSRTGQPLQCLTDWNDILKTLQENKIHFYGIPGNHDKTDQDDERSYLDVYSNFSNMHLFRSAGVHIFGGALVAFIPFYSDEVWLKAYKEIEEIKDAMFIDGDMEKDAACYLIAHSGFDGVMNNDGSKVESVIKPSMFKGWSKVLIGHYHNASKLAKNVIYTGSAYQNNYGETWQDKGCTVLFDDGSIEFIPLKFPKYIKETIDVNDTESLRNILEKYDGETYDHIRLIFVGSKVDAKKVNIAELSAKGFDAKYQSIEETEAVEASQSDVVMCYDKKAIIKDFSKFCSENSIKGEKLRYGLNLIKSI